jgi:alanine racemase
MVRPGIGLYGISNDEDEQKYLENVALNLIISQIRTTKLGESVMAEDLLLQNHPK